MSHYPEDSLRAHLDHEPRPLRFGTSGRRGEVLHLTQLEIYINALADIEYLKSLPLSEGGVRPGDPFYVAYDLRPSSTRFVPEQSGRGEIAQAVVQAITDAGLRPVNLGAIPTPALMYVALQARCGSIMITGSHIPFDRNGFKTSTATRELLKSDEGPVAQRVAEIRERLYRQPYRDSAFDARGMFRSGHRDLPAVADTGRVAYRDRYLHFFGGDGQKPLKGLRLLVYQHSAVGRDLLAEILAGLGAEAIPAGRSETFVPIDTENMDAERLATIQSLLDDATSVSGPIDGVVSTDGDSDRPLVLGVTSEGGVQFFPGDLVGMITAEYLGADAVVVPISCNDAIDRSALRDRLEPKTRIGSPYVIAGMEQARARGRQVVCGWEANGGFLLGSHLIRGNRTLTALPTRDAVLPILSVLLDARERGLSLVQRFDQLPKRFGATGLLRNVPMATGQAFVARFLPPDPAVVQVERAPEGIRAYDARSARMPITPALAADLETCRAGLSRALAGVLLLDDIVYINYTDGVRATDARGQIVHLRPSGNADEFRIYTVADTAGQAQALLQACLHRVGALLGLRPGCEVK